MTADERKKQVKKEQLKLSKIFRAALDDDDYKKAEALIENAAFQRTALMELKENILEHGYVETYVHGENQYGQKDSSYLRAYNNLIKTYHTNIKLLLSIAPAVKQAVKSDGFDSF